MKLLVLAGGFGSRLKAAIPDVPKALAPINGVPFLQFQLTSWVSQGLREFTFLLHHQAGQIIAFLEGQRSDVLKDCKINWLIESTPMDTGGAIAHAVKMLDLTGNFLITNADTWLSGGITDLMHSPAPSIAIVQLTDVGRYGQVYCDQAHFITSFVEKKSQIEPGCINAGLYHLSAELFHSWDGLAFSLEKTLFPALVENRSLVAVPLQTDFIDIGVPDDYLRFCRWVKDGCRTSLCA